MFQARLENIPQVVRYPKLIRELGTIEKEGWEEIDGFRLRKNKDIMYQAGFQEAIQICEADVIFSGGTASSGKGHPLSHEIVTPFGYRKMGDLKVGSIITGAEGGMQKVVQIHELGKKDVYRVTFIDGVTCDVTDEHLWNVRKMRHTSKKSRLNGFAADEDWRVWDTKMIMAHLNRKPNIHISIPLSQPVKFTKGVSLPIDPYLLGCLIGDGCLTVHGEVFFSSMDPEIIDRLNATGVTFKKRGKSGCDYRMVKPMQFIKLLEQLKLQGCYSHEKFIPAQYKLAPVAERMALMQGLMDTDGYAGKGVTGVGFSSASERLSKDIQEIVWSLGGMATLFKKETPCLPAYALYIQTHNNSDLFLLDRKVKTVMDRRYVKTRRIMSVEHLDEQPCRCITVSNPDSLYLAGRGCVVTHNSYGLLMEALRGLGMAGYSGLIVKKELVEVNTAGGILSDAKRIYKPMLGCEFASSDFSFRWDAWDGTVMLTHINLQGEAQEKEAQEKMKNKQASYIGIDELTNFTFKVWKYWFSRNRDGSGMKPKMICTMNANGWHFSRAMLGAAGFIGEDNYVIPEMIGVLKYFVIQGDKVEDMVWGSSKEEIKSKIDLESRLTKEMRQQGLTADHLIKSFTFIPGNIMDNRIMTFQSQGGNVANLFNVGEAERLKLLYGYWGEMNEGEAMVTSSQIRAMFTGENPLSEDQSMYMTVDFGDGGDATKAYIWKGLSVIGIRISYSDDAKFKVAWVDEIRREHGIPINHIAVDAGGLGNYFEDYMKGVVAIVSNRVPLVQFDEAGNKIEFEQYVNLRDQLLGKLTAYIISGRLRVEIPAETRFKYGRKGEDLSLQDILVFEAGACLKRYQKENQKYYFLSKIAFKRRFGYSPDDLDPMAYRMVFELDTTLKKEADPIYDVNDYYAAFNGGGETWN